MKNLVNLQDHIKSNESISTNEFKEFVGFNDNRLAMRRFNSFLVDFILIAILNIVTFVSFRTIVANFTYFTNTQVEFSFILNLFVFSSLYCSYFLFFNLFHNGSTFGQMIFKLKSINSNHIHDAKNPESMTFKQIFLRTLGLYINYLSFGSFFAFNYMTENKNGIVEIISGTEVVTNEWLEYHEKSSHVADQSVYIDINHLEQAS